MQDEEDSKKRSGTPPQSGSSKRTRTRALGDGILNVDNPVWHIIISFCPAPTLASLDLTCKKFSDSTALCWERCAMQRFGVFGATDGVQGKERWRRGCALVRPGQHVAVTLSRQNPEMAMMGSPKLAVSAFSGRVAVGSDDHHHTEVDQVRRPIVVRNVFNRNDPIQLLEGEISTWQIAFCGTGSDEILANGCTNEHLYAQRLTPHSAGGNPNNVRLNLADIAKQRGLESFQSECYSLEILGCKRFLLVARHAHFFFFVPDVDQVIKLVQVTSIDSADPRATHNGMSWVSPELGPDCFCASTQPGRVLVWQVDEVAEGGFNLQTITDVQTTKTEDPLETIAVSNSYVAVSPGSTKRLYVYSRDAGSSGQLIHTLNEEMEENREQYEDIGGSTFPLSMFVTGEILVSSSIRGVALCVWDMRQGVLLHRILDFLDRRTPHFHDELPEGSDITSLMPIYDQGAVCFVVFCGPTQMFVFPSSVQRRAQLQSLAEEELRGDEEEFE